MQLRMSTAPAMWGVEAPDAPANPPWSAVLDAIAEAGFEGTELGPLGYLPERAFVLREALRGRSLALSAGYVMAPFHDAASAAEIAEVARRTSALLRDVGARHLVLIQAYTPARARTAGRSTDAPRLDQAARRLMLSTIATVAETARDHGLQATFHPHAGTAVEFADEIDALMSDLGPDVGLCLDTGHAVYAGIDPVELLRTFGDRVRYVHLKDVRAEVLERCLAEGLSFAAAVDAGVFCPLGEGAVDFAAVAAELEAAGYDGWATIEQDRVSDHGDARADAEASLEHARRVGLAGPAREGVR